jgi:hypothetical protein
MAFPILFTSKTRRLHKLTIKTNAPTSSPPTMETVGSYTMFTGHGMQTNVKQHDSSYDQ